MYQILTTLILSLLLVGVALITIQKKLFSTSFIINAGKIILGAEVFTALGLLILFYLNDYTHLQYFPEIIRFDTLSITMFLMVSIIGFIVLKFSESYLQGDSNYEEFIKKLFLTISFVQLLVISGNLFYLVVLWITTSLSLQQLILFYKERKGAQAAVKKKNVVARASDFFLLSGVLFLYFEFNTANLETIFLELKTISPGQLSLYLELSALFLTLAAIIKSIQIPFHGWILEVMEAPTPVSGLLHAGLINAGPFLIIRFSYLIELSTLATVLLLTIGGLSAIYGTLVFPSQPSIKKSLAYSSIGHMGFSLMICGLGLYSAALLHLIAHSFYKAHSFLSSGSVIDKYRLKMLDGNTIKPAVIAQFIVGVLITSIVFLSVVYLMNQQKVDQFQTIVLTALIIIGVSSFIVKISTPKNGLENILKSIFAVGILLSSFFLFEGAFNELFKDVIPVASEPSIIVKSISIGLVFIFMIAAFSSLLNENSSIVSKWQIYKRNGFYIHLIFDRFLNSFSSNNKILND